MKCPNCSIEIILESPQGTFPCPYCSKQLFFANENTLSVFKSFSIFDNQSKICLGTKGVFKGISFTVIGEVQLSNLFHTWSEWCLEFSDLTYGWLSDFGSKYFIKFDTSASNEEFIGSLWGEKTLLYLKKLDEMNPPLYMSRLVFENVNFSYCYKITGSVVNVRGVLPFAPTQQNISYLYTQNLEKEFFFSFNSLTSTHMVCEYVSENSLLLFNYRELIEYFSLVGGKKFRLHSFNCPECSSSNPRVVGLTPVTYCINCGIPLNTSFKSPAAILGDIVYKNPKAPLLDFMCGQTGTINGLTYLIIGVTYYGEDLVDYFIHSKYNKTKSFILRKFNNNWYILEFSPLNFSSNLEELHYKSTEETNHSVVYISGALPIFFDYTSTNIIFKEDGYFYHNLCTISNTSQLLFKSPFVMLTKEETKLNFKFVEFVNQVV